MTDGLLDLGAYAVNPNAAAAAHPDGSGAALFKYHGLVADAADGDRLRFIGEGVFLTDRDSPNSFKPVSADYLLGASARMDRLRIQFDREEALALRGNGAYSNWDVRGSLLLGSPPVPGAEEKGPPNGVSAALTVGYLLHNNATPARGDGTGLESWRYDAAAEARLFGGLVLLRADADVLADQTHRPRNPADLDLDVSGGTAYGGFEYLVSWRMREALDRSGYASYWLFSLRHRFDSRTFISAM